MKQRIVLLGPPAAGKGTQAELIQARYGIPIASPGAMLRDEKRRGTSLGISAEKITSQGKLLPDEIVIDLVTGWLGQQTGGFIFDGFPRSVGQADALNAALKSRYEPLEAVISLEVKPEALFQRVASRLVCAECGAIFSIGLHVRNAAVPCLKCGGPLGKRSDDTPDTLKARLAEYSEKTAPVLGYYENSEVFCSVDANPSPDVVFAAVDSIIQ